MTPLFSRCISFLLVSQLQSYLQTNNNNDFIFFLILGEILWFPSKNMKETSQCSHYLKPLMLRTTRLDLSHDDIAYHVLPTNSMAQTDSSHLHNPYGYASGILGEESPCGLKRTGATILKVIFKSSYFDGPYHCGI